MIKNLIGLKMYTLQKAHKLQERLRTVQQELSSPSTTIDAMIHEDWEEKANLLQAEHHKVLCESVLIEEVITEIRIEISQANAKWGISRILGEIRGYEAQLALLQKTSREPIREAPAVVKKQIELKTKNSESDRYFGSNSVEVSIFEQQWQADMALQAKATKKKIRELEDKRQEINLSTKIELSKSAVTLLAAYELD
jgi:hypothetical protein